MIKLARKKGSDSLRRRCDCCMMLAYHHRAGRDRILNLCNRHERRITELGLTTRDDVEAYVVIVKTFGEVSYDVTAERS